MRNLLATSVVFLAACSATIEATPEYGFTKFDGDFAISNAGVSGTTSMEDLGLDDSEERVAARADFKWGLPHLSVELGKTGASGDGTTTADLTQGGTTITAGTAVNSDIDLTYGNAILTFDILPTDTFELGIGLGIEGADLQTKVTETATGNQIDTSETIPIPVLALRLGVGLGPIRFDALLDGMSLTYEGDDLDFFSMDLRARWEIFDHAHLLVGWHSWSVDLDYEDGSDNVRLDVTAEGPYLGIVFAF